MKVSCILAAFFVLETVEGLRVPSIQTQLRAGSHNRISPLRVPSAHINIHMSEKDQKQKLPFFLDINTKGGIIFYSIIGIVLPFIAYSFMVDVLDLGVVLAGNVILVLYVGLGIFVWTGSYVFRVANKDMTYAQQLKDYENAVIQKRFEELSEEEVNALMGEIYPEPPSPEKK